MPGVFRATSSLAYGDGALGKFASGKRDGLILDAGLIQTMPSCTEPRDTLSQPGVIQIKACWSFSGVDWCRLVSRGTLSP